jgi:hypothetical protein
MGLLRGLLTFPVSAPVGGALWVAGQIHDAAARELTDPAAIRRALADLERELDAGRIDEDAFEDAEELLLRRLREAGR